MRFQTTRWNEPCLGTRLDLKPASNLEVVVAVTGGRLDGSTERSTEGFGRAQPRASRRGHAKVFGTWERIFCGEFERQRRKRMLVKTIGE